ncbi:MAG: SH3 domain-containing protein [Chloroflexi bacterium]|nr:SH3 domain-containing protein [Chloroflexota bacterium]
MKAKLLTTIIAVLLLCSLASAQGYDIRATGRNNLRAAPSLDGAFLETVPSGTVLHVVGRSGRWLQISRNGNEVWMADWVGYSRVEGGEPTASQPASNVPAQVDNCCFVDRQCNTEQDWTDGYWAFQNGQCAAPAQSQTPAQPASSSPAQVNNCCFVDRQCSTDAEWTDGYYAYQNGQCPASSVTQPGVAAPIVESINVWTPNMTEGVKQFLANPSRDPFNNCCYMHHNTCHSEEDWQRGAAQYQNRECVHPAPLWTLPTVVSHETPVGGARFTDLVNAALDLMRNHAPEWLKYLQVSGVRRIELLPGYRTAGFFNQQWLTGLGYWSEQQNDPNWTPDFNYILSYANGITHEACHAIKQRVYTQTAGWANEVPCLEAGSAVSEAIRAGS